MTRALVMPPLGVAAPPTARTVEVTRVLQLRGALPDTPTGVALANTPEVVEYDDAVTLGPSANPKGSAGGPWGMVSQTLPDTVLTVPEFPDARQWLDHAQAPHDGAVAVTAQLPLGDDTLTRHELAGLVADQMVALATGAPAHYRNNVLSVDAATGAAVSQFQYAVSHEDLIRLRLAAVACWLRRATSPAP
jgi:hypothetical protein